MATKSRIGSERTAEAASKVGRSGSSPTKPETTAASPLARRAAAEGKTLQKAGKAASKVRRGAGAGQTPKSAAGSAVVERLPRTIKSAPKAGKVSKMDVKRAVEAVSSKRAATF